ncbi:MAG: M14 metallopeptidase family protein, partial [Bacillota bacterium]
MTRRVTSPLEFFGHIMGEDRKIARWDKIVDYFNLLAKESDRIQVTDMGPSTEGNPFLLAVISSPANLAKLDHYRGINLQISDPRGLTEEAIKALVKEGKAVVVQSMSMHATEIGGTQMAPELAYDLLVGECEETQRILDNVIFLMVPCFNPDGQIMVTDWYDRWVGTEYEGCSLPWLYQKYTGHDNNRDAFMLNIVESQYMAKLLFRDWKPQAYQDHHHMGSYGARLFVAPYSEPIRPDGDPLVWRELSWYGAHMAYRLEEAGKTGILNAGQYPGWGHYGFHWITIHHNIAGMLTESASAKLATPLYIHPTQLEGTREKSMPEYAAQTNFPHPWEGGWWRLRDIVEQQKISAWALLDIMARNKDTLLWNAYLKATRQTERGEEGKPYAYVIEPEQHDPLTARKLVQLLLNQGIEVKVADQPFKANGKTYPAGTYVVMLQQPKRGLIKALLGRTLFPLNSFNTGLDGSPRVFDCATDTVAEYMGVDVQPIEKKFAGAFAVVHELAQTVVPAVSG